MTRSAVRSPAAQRISAAATCVSVALSSGAAAVITLRTPLFFAHPTKRPESGQCHGGTAPRAKRMQPDHIYFSGAAASAHRPRPYPLRSHRATTKPRESAMQLRTILAASAAVIVGAVSVQAAEVAALSGDNTISIVNTSSKSVTKTWKIQGVSGKVLGIDLRPADGMLYAVGADGDHL